MGRRKDETRLIWEKAFWFLTAPEKIRPFLIGPMERFLFWEMSVCCLSMYIMCICVFVIACTCILYIDVRGQCGMSSCTVFYLSEMGSFTEASSPIRQN